MSPLTRTLVETLLIGASGLGLGLIGNSLSPAGLRIDRDYFPSAASPSPRAEPAAPPAVPPTEPPAVLPKTAATPATPPATTPTAPAETPTATPPTAPATTSAAPPSDVEQAALAHLAEHGLSGIRFDEARALFDDPLYQAGGLLFIDARRDEDYAAGHVPNALQFDHYHAERYLDAVLQAAPGTSRIVVYCAGGECEDSEFAALTLKDFLPDPARICVYVGGIEEWRARGMPIETGERGSGQIEGQSK